MQKTTLAELLSTHNRSAIARKVQRSRATVHRWASGQGVPAASDLPRLSEILHIDLAELARIVAADANRLEGRPSLVGAA